MKDYLSEIVEHKRAELKKLLPLEGKLRASAILRNDYAGFRTAVDLGEHCLSVIPEVSRCFPPVTHVLSDEEWKQNVKMFLQGGVQGISVTVEPTCYHGSWDMVSTISRESPVPVLARDYILHPVHVCQAIVCGADAVNLIPSIIPDDELEPLYKMATGLGIDVMLEVHTMEDLERALDLDPELICINNTNPHTLEIHLDTTEKLIEEIQANVTVLTCGGIDSVAVARQMLDLGVNGVLLQQELTPLAIPQDFIQDIRQLTV